MTQIEEVKLGEVHKLAVDTNGSGNFGSNFTQPGDSAIHRHICDDHGQGAHSVYMTEYILKGVDHLNQKTIN